MPEHKISDTPLSGLSNLLVKHHAVAHEFAGVDDFLPFQ
jgi:hypothetical protein